MFDLLMSPGMRRAEQEYLETRLKEAEPWNEDKTKFQPFLTLQGSTFDTKPYWVFDVEPTRESFSGKLPKACVVSPNGKFVYANRILPRGSKLELAQGHQRGAVAFDTDVVAPVLFEHDEERKYSPLKVWMGITPMEVLTQRQGVRVAKGKVLIGGLGLGWLLKKVAAKKSVTEIVVVEISGELLRWYGREMCEKVAHATGKKVVVIQDDVINHIGRHGEDTRHLLDVWMDYPNHVRYLPDKWQEAIRKVRHFWGWGVLAEKESGW